MFSSQKEEARESRPLTDRLEESEEDYDSRDSIDHALPAKRPSKRRSNVCIYITIATLFLVSNIISLFLGGLIYSQATDLDSECAAHTAKYCKCSSGEELEASPAHTVASSAPQGR